MDGLDLLFFNALRKGEGDSSPSEPTSDLAAESSSEPCSYSDPESDPSLYSRELLVKYSSWSSSVMVVLETPFPLEALERTLRVRASDFCGSAIVKNHVKGGKGECGIHAS